MHVLIREFIPSDANRISELEQQCNPMPWSVKAIHSKSLALVAILPNSNVVGYLVFSWVADESEILILGVDPVFRRMKIGSQLLAEFISQSQNRGCQKIFLEVREKNTAAIALYQNAGFYKIGIRSKYYADTGENAFLLGFSF